MLSQPRGITTMAGRGGGIENNSKLVTATLLKFPEGIGQSLKRPWRLALLAAAVLISALAATFGLIYWKATRALKAAQQELKLEREHGFTVVRLERTPDNAFTWIRSPAAFFGAAIFQGHLFVCGSAGMLEYDQSGK